MDANDTLNDTLGKLIQDYLDGSVKASLDDIINYVSSTDVRELVHGDGEGGYK